MGQKSSPRSTCHVLSGSCTNRALCFLRWRWQGKKIKKNFHSGASQTRALGCSRCPSLGLREFVLSQTITFFSVQTETLISPRGRAASRLPELPPCIRVTAVVENLSNIVSLAPFAVKELNYEFRLCKKRQKPRGIQGLRVDMIFEDFFCI